MAKPFLVLQLRPEDEAADNELEAFMQLGGIKLQDIHRVRLEKESLPSVSLTDYSGIIVGGGPSNISDPEDQKTAEQRRFEADLHKLLDGVIEEDMPFLGACYGIGLLANHLGGRVSKERYGEDVGAVTIRLTETAASDPLTRGLPESFKAFAGHKEACQEVPPGAALLASSESCPVQMIRVGQNVYATQFHTELDRAGLALRINIYRNAGYFPPEDAEMLIAASEHEEVTVPEIILKRFVSRYQS